MTTLETLCRIAETEFATIVVQTDTLGAKVRILLVDTSYVDIWLSRTLPGRFGFHWERRHLDGQLYRYDNLPDTHWQDIATFPCHFHQGSQEVVSAAPFAPDPEQGFRDFMEFVRSRLPAP